MKKDTLKILDSTLSLKAEGWTDVRKMLKKVQFICRVHELKWIDVQYEGFTMMVEPGSDIDALAAEFEEWEKLNKDGDYRKLIGFSITTRRRAGIKTQ
jgi:hypothetical protein